MRVRVRVRVRLTIGVRARARVRLGVVDLVAEEGGVDQLEAHRARGDAVRVGSGAVHPADGVAHALARVLGERLLRHREHEEQALQEKDALVRGEG